MNIEDTSLEDCKILWTKNIVSIWFQKQDGLRHNGSANVECLNFFVYRKFVCKKAKIGAYHVEITPHRRSLEGNEKYKLPQKSPYLKLNFHTKHKPYPKNKVTSAYRLHHPTTNERP